MVAATELESGGRVNIATDSLISLDSCIISLGEVMRTATVAGFDPADIFNSGSSAFPWLVASAVIPTVGAKTFDSVDT